MAAAAAMAMAGLRRSPAVWRHSASLHRSWTRTHPNPDHFLSPPFPIAQPSHKRFLFGSIIGTTILIGLDRSNGQNTVFSKSEAEFDSEEICNEEDKIGVKDVAKIKEEKAFPKREYIDPLDEVVDLQKEKDKLLGEEALQMLVKLMENIHRDLCEMEKKRECGEKEKEKQLEDIQNKLKILHEGMKKLGEGGSKGNEGGCYYASILKGLENFFGLPMRLMKLKATIAEGTELVIAAYMFVPTVLLLNKTDAVSKIKETWQELCEKASSLGVPPSSTTSNHPSGSPSSSVDAVPLPPTPPSADAGDDKDGDKE